MERAYKYHGIGNDFLILDRRIDGIDISDDTARALCDRHRGVGADGVLVLLPSSRGEARMVVHNADGSIPEMCGNGVRCVVKYLIDTGTLIPDSLTIETGAGPLRCEISYQGVEVSSVRVSMGPARLVAPNLPSGRTGVPFVDEELAGHPGLRGTAVSMGNPHLVLFSTPLEEAAALGEVLERHPLFPERTNVGFARLQTDGLSLVVWERGAGLTQACGTGACAAVAAAVYEGRLQAEAWHAVRLPGGVLSIWVHANLSEVKMEGPAEKVFTVQVL